MLRNDSRSTISKPVMTQPNGSGGRSKIAGAYTTCPFCEGGKSFLVSDADRTKNDVLNRLAGTRVECEHRRCGRTYEVRRADIRVRFGGR